MIHITNGWQRNSHESSCFFCTLSSFVAYTYWMFTRYIWVRSVPTEANVGIGFIRSLNYNHTISFILINIFRRTKIKHARNWTFMRSYNIYLTTANNNVFYRYGKLLHLLKKNSFNWYIFNLWKNKRKLNWVCRNGRQTPRLEIFSNNFCEKKISVQYSTSICWIDLLSISF